MFSNVSTLPNVTVEFKSSETEIWKIILKKIKHEPYYISCLIICGLIFIILIILCLCHYSGIPHDLCPCILSPLNTLTSGCCACCCSPKLDYSHPDHDRKKKRKYKKSVSESSSGSGEASKLMKDSVYSRDIRDLVIRSSPAATRCG